jgi:sterol 3beta-glucosyltransferase
VRVVITNFGTRGDFQPLCGLAQVALERKHHPIFALPECSVGFIDQFGFDTHVLETNLTSLRDRINERWIADPKSYRDRQELWELLKPFEAHLARCFEGLLAACKRADVLISGPAQPLSRVVHDYTGIPFVSVQFSNFGGFGGTALDEAGDMLVNPFRRRIGLGAVMHPLTTGANSPQLALYAMSRHLWNEGKHWPPHHHFTGFWFVSQQKDVASKVAAFMDEGRQPIVVSLGSMKDCDGDEIDGLIIEACRRNGRRVVLQTGLETSETCEDVLRVGYVPHGWLFARAACVITHGGAGTAAAVFRSGKPGIFVPHGEIYDQAYWGRLAFDMGCAVKPILRGDLDVESLTRAIGETLASESIKSECGALAQKIRGENGSAAAWRLIEDTVQRIGLDG